MKVVYPTNMLPLYLIMNTSTRTIYSSLQRIHMMYSHGRRPRHSPTIILPPLLLSGPAFILLMAPLLSLLFDKTSYNFKQCSVISSLLKKITPFSHFCRINNFHYDNLYGEGHLLHTLN